MWSTFVAWNATTGGAIRRAVSDESIAALVRYARVRLRAACAEELVRFGTASPDYYLLLDEQADNIFAMRLAAHMREAGCICAEYAHPVAASRLEIWMDDAGKQVWYVFEGSPQ
jgi:hypothetical protein